MTLLAATALATVGATGGVEVGLRFLQLAVALRAQLCVPRTEVDHPQQSARPDHFVSVHVPVHNEPPDLVIASLRALAKSRDCDFEVIVIDNNTPDPATWLPLEKECASLGPRFRFFHVEDLAGAKAGALNLALTKTDPRASHVAIVDADYQVGRGFLSDGLSSLERAGADYAQFPQAYRAVIGDARGVEHELGDYFACFEAGSGRPGSMLPTGTLSLFSLYALRIAGGWPTATITEDAEIGVRLQRCGFRGLWLMREGGRGLLPVDLHGLQIQRARWAAGNLQVLKHLYGRRWPGLSASDRLILTVQLTAWLSLWLPLAGALVLAALTPSSSWTRQVGGLAAAAMLLSLLLTAVRMALPSKSKPVEWRARLGAVATKLALTWTSATAWLPALSPKSLAFVRTAKRRKAERPRRLLDVGAPSCGFAVLAGVYLFRGQPMEATACGMLASVWSCARFVDKGLSQAAESNPELQTVLS